MEQTFSDMSVQMAVERAGASELVMMVAKDVHDVLRPNEFVLEFADTTSPGFHSALAVTGYSSALVLVSCRKLQWIV